MAAFGVLLEVLAGLIAGIYGTGRLLFGFFAVSMVGT